MTTPFLIFIDGPMGSGKTTTTKLLNQKLPDTARIAMSDIKRLVPNYKENPNTLVVLKDIMGAMIDKYLEHGVSVIVELVTKADGIEMLRQLTQKHKAKFYGYRLTAARDTRLARVHERTKAMMEITELSQSKIDELTEYFEPNDQFYIDNPIDGIETIDTDNLNSEQVVEIIINKMS